jgi:hypothetical protein
MLGPTTDKTTYTGKIEEEITKKADNIHLSGDQIIKREIEKQENLTQIVNDIESIQNVLADFNSFSSEFKTRAEKFTTRVVLISLY